MHRITQLWQSMTIKKKIQVFTIAVFVACLFSFVFNLWVVKFSLVDFGQMLEGNSQSVNLVQALEKETEAFQNYVQRRGITKGEYENIVRDTAKAVQKLPFDYSKIGEKRYAITWSILNSYEVYVERREEFLQLGRENQNYINDLYKIYEMQDYLVVYAKKLMTDTIEISSEQYVEKIPGLIKAPWLIVTMGFVLLVVVLNLSHLMNKTIMGPVMKLVDASKRIAENDYFVEDVQVANQDELGELVHAFNKMKYATGVYISALEEKRKTLDLLHAEELEKLEIENQLESIKLDLLKSQVNPHFLFNTLNVIGGMANLEDAQTTEKMINALSSLFRYNLKTDDIEVPLVRELKVVEDYMYLQQMRFGDRISYEIECEADKNKMLVPAFTFQPLVENAIVHGLSRKEEGGKVKVKVRLKGRKLYIFIGDTGKGMKPTELSALKTKLKNQKQGGQYRGIGLGNIYYRVNAMYTEGKVEIYSKENKGTVIIVVIPQEGES